MIIITMIFLTLLIIFIIILLFTTGNTETQVQSDSRRLGQSGLSRSESEIRRKIEKDDLLIIEVT